MRRTGGGALLLLSLFSFGQPTAPQAKAAELMPVRYEAPADCPTAAAFRDQIRSRISSEAWLGFRPGLRLEVTIEREDAGYAAELTIDGGSMRGHRSLTGATCEGLVSALGLMAAVALDLERSRQPAEARQRSSTAPPLNPAGAVDAATSRRARPVKVQLGLAGAFEPLLGASLTPALIPSVGLDWYEANVVRFAWAPRVRVAFLRTSQTTRQDAFEAHLQLLAGQIEVCPARIGLVGPLALRPCLIGQAGRIAARGGNVEDARRRNQLWLNAGAVAQLAWEIVAGLAIEAEGGVVAAFSRHRFYVDPETTLYTTPALGGLVSAGLAFRFP